MVFRRAFLGISLFSLFLNTSASICKTDEWSSWGGNNCNNRFASENTDINSSSIASLTQHCKFDFPLGVSATPSIKGNQVYFPTWGGLLVSADYTSCKILWQTNVTKLIADFAPITSAQLATSNPVSRSTPVIVDDILYFTTLTHALLCAADPSTGTVHGCTQINPHPLAILTMSPTVYKISPYDQYGVVLIGSSSQESLAPTTVPGYQCCSFVGNMAGLTFNEKNLTSPFTTLWNVSMLPSNGNWSGAAVWGSQPSIDHVRKQTFIGTGNVYTLPASYAKCKNLTASIPASALQRDPCLPSNVFQDSILALDILTGLVNWVYQAIPLDAYNTACDPTSPAATHQQNCPFTPGPDADFGMAPAYIPASANTPHQRDTVVAGQKNGNLYALSAQAGRPFWTALTSPDGGAGGLVWGVAVDESRVYYTALNFDGTSFLLQPSGKNISNSAYGAAALADGSFVWQTQVSGGNASLSEVPPTVVGDVVFAGRSGVNISDAYAGHGGTLAVLDKTTGSLLKELDLPANHHGGIAVQGEYVLFGIGYQTFVNQTGSLVVLKVGT